MVMDDDIELLVPGAKKILKICCTPAPLVVYLRDLSIEYPTLKILPGLPE